MYHNKLIKIAPLFLGGAFFQKQENFSNLQLTDSPQSQNNGGNNTLILRDFYYLDQKRVTRFISTIEDGLIKHVQQKHTQNSPSWKFEISSGELQTVLTNMFGIPLPKFKINRKNKDDNVTINTSKEQTIDSQYERLETYLEDVTQNLNNISVENWSSLENEQFVYFEGNIDLPQGFTNTSFLEAATTLYEFGMQLTDEIKDEEFEQEKGKIKAYVDKANDTDKTVIYFTPKGSPNPHKYYLFGQIIHSNLDEIDLTEMTNGYYKVFGRIEHVLNSSDKITVYDPTQSGAIDMANREQRRKQNISNPDTAVKPAIKIKPIAIYKG